MNRVCAGPLQEGPSCFDWWTCPCEDAIPGPWEVGGAGGGLGVGSSIPHLVALFYSLKLVDGVGGEMAFPCSLVSGTGSSCPPLLRKPSERASNYLPPPHQISHLLLVRFSKWDSDAVDKCFPG